jgi:uncharacterized repeat protein (TIGR03803 family)
MLIVGQDGILRPIGNRPRTRSMYYGRKKRMLRPSQRQLFTALFVLAAPVATPPVPAQTFTVVYQFAKSDGELPSGLVADAAGNLYGTTLLGGASDAGVAFELNSTGETVLHTFTGTDGSDPTTGVVRDWAGNLFGATAGGATPFGEIFKLDTDRNVTVLHSFTGGADGGEPNGLVQDFAGNLYGTTYTGGATGHGVAFKLDSSGTETVLHNFGGADGIAPASPLIRDWAGNLYGTTFRGGAFGYGVVFKLDPAGQETVLYSFTGGADGGKPHAGLTLDWTGNLYGTTAYGGQVSHPACRSGCGVVFKLDTAGSYKVLHTFTGGTDGMIPTTSLILDWVGNLYGTTSTGGMTGWGVVFKVDPAGHETVLHAFTGGSDGGDPETGLIRDGLGTLYGTTGYGPSNYGAVFRLTP